jgi:hypothetical protein
MYPSEHGLLAETCQGWINYQWLITLAGFINPCTLVTVSTRAIYWYLSRAISIQPIQTHPISLISILILFSSLRLGLPSGLLHSRFPSKSYLPFSSPSLLNVNIFITIHYLLWATYNCFRNTLRCWTIPWNRIPLGNMLTSQSPSEFPAFHKIRRFIATCIITSRCYISWARWIHPIFWRPISLKSILIVAFI